MIRSDDPDNSTADQSVADPKIEDAAPLAISAKMAKALADRWRSRILMELSTRPMSPSKFVELVGGELATIGRCFRQLAEWGYIEVAETRSGRGRRQGGIEHVYRAIHRAHFDTTVWEELPRVHRDAFSGSILDSYLRRVQEAVDAGTFDEEIDRHLSWDEIALDRIGWMRLGAQLNDVLYGIPGLEIEALERIAQTREDPIQTTVHLASFRAATDQGLHRAPRQPPEPIRAPGSNPFLISAKTAKAVASKWRSRILMELRVRPLSATQFVAEIGGGRRHIARCFRQLAEWDYIEVVETRSGGRRRGGMEKYYRLKRRAHFDTPTWELLPRFLRDEFSESILQSYFARVTEALEAETFDAEIDRHLSWVPVALDRVGWKELGARLDQVLYSLSDLERSAAERMEVSDEPPIPTIVGLSAFRSPKSSEITPKAKREGR